jgi:hypothetical protein
VRGTSYRARSASEMVDGAIQLWRTNFSMFLLLGGLLYVPIVAFQLFARGDTDAPTAPSAASVGVVLMLALLFVIWLVACYAVIMTVTSDLYLSGTADIGDAIRRTRPRLGAAIATSILAFLGVAVGFLLFIVPGVLIGLSLFACQPVSVLESVGPRAALSRSATLSRGIKGHIAASLTLLGLLTGVITILGQVLAVVFLASEGTVGRVVAQVVTAAVSICLGALPPIMTTLLYYDARIRNEGFDIELMARSVGGTPAPAPAF